MAFPTPFVQVGPTAIWGQTPAGNYAPIAITAPVAATGTLTLAGNAVAGETVTIGQQVYVWAASANTQTPNVVKVGSSASVSIDNLIAAINATAASQGSLYSFNTIPNLQVTAAAGAGDTMDVTAITAGANGNLIATLETMSQGSWAHPTLINGAGGAIEVDATVTIDPSSLATSANQTTQITAEQAIQAATEKVIPATTAAAVTPSDSTPLTSRAVWVGGGGDVSVRLSGATSTTVVFTNVPSGSLLPMSVVRVMAATTATDIVVLN